VLTQGRRRESDRAGERNRTTAMLVAVVLCFVVTELPQGVLACWLARDTVDLLGRETSS